MNKEILVVIFVIIAGLSGLATLYFVNNSNLVTHSMNNLSSDGIGIASGGNKTPEQFFRDGGRSYILVTPDSEYTNATIGSTVQIPLTITHKASGNPWLLAKLHYVGVKCCFSLYGQSRFIDWNSTVKTSDNEFSLLAGESKKVILSISIPSDLPKSSVNATIPYNVWFALPDDYNPKEIVSSIAFVQIHIVG